MYIEPTCKHSFNINFAAEAMDSLVTKILELSSREASLPVDVVDLGGSDGAVQQDSHTPNHTRTEYTNGNSNYDDSTGYSKVSNMRGLAGHIPSSNQENQRSTCC